ncbi:hypothetical protein ANSO36C_13410 [Nostoc cf. commune SO-36]|uniref:histidine kinase n=1 Tax=Nostoc cf. commune SO-36 TaxID=449208 RepID=A0ABM7YY36_NOSCO|nr:hypothetical protein ANSO36C_13410 [Nostoc cf. commune SO-36]
MLIPEGRDISEQQAALRERQKAEETLRQNEERWQLAIAGTKEGIWDWDISTNQTFRSRRWFTMLGYEPNELSDRDDEWSIRIHPDDYARVMAAQEAYLLRQVSDYKVEYRLRCKNGSYRWFKSRAKGIWNKQGNPLRLVGSLEDITDRIQTEERLRRSEALLATTQQIAHVGSWEFNLETKKRCWSIETFRIFGLNPTQSEPTEEEFLQIVHPDDRAWMKTHIQQAIAQETFFNTEYRIVRPDGLVRYLEAKAEIAYDPQGQAVKLLGSVLDITERKQTEAALARSEEQLRLTLEFNHIGIWDWNLKTGEVVWNDNHYRLLGLEPEISVASYQLWRDCVHPEDVDQIEQAVSNALEQHTNFQGEYRVIYPNGSVHWFTGKGRGVYNEVGDPVQMLGVIIDISDVYDELRLRKQAEAALRESEARFQAFMNNSPVLAWISNTDGHILYSNQVYLRTFQLLPEQVIGQSVFDLYHR